jgi:hypothetical protein
MNKNEKKVETKIDGLAGSNFLFRKTKTSE